MHNFISILGGTLFGIVLTKSEVISWFRIQKMFLFDEPYMYLIIGTAVTVGAISILVLKKLGIKSFTKEELDFSGKELNKGTIIGGILFGIGWAITGACPGPIFAQIGAGETAALITLSGAVTGVFVFNIFKNRLP